MSDEDIDPKLRRIREFIISVITLGSLVQHTPAISLNTLITERFNTRLEEEVGLEDTKTQTSSSSASEIDAETMAVDNPRRT